MIEIRFDVIYKQDLIEKYDTQMGKPFLTDLTAYLRDHTGPKCWPIVIRWKKLKIKGWFFDTTLILIEKIMKAPDTPCLTITWGEK